MSPRRLRVVKVSPHCSYNPNAARTAWQAESGFSTKSLRTFRQFLEYVIAFLKYYYFRIDIHLKLLGLLSQPVEYYLNFERQFKKQPSWLTAILDLVRFSLFDYCLLSFLEEPDYLRKVGMALQALATLTTLVLWRQIEWNRSRVLELFAILNSKSQCILLDLTTDMWDQIRRRYVLATALAFGFSVNNALVVGVDKDSWRRAYAELVVCYTIYYPMAVFHVTCYMFKLRLVSIERRLRHVNSLQRIYDFSIRMLVTEFGETVRTIRQYNKFWSRQIGLLYFLFACLSVMQLYGVLTSHKLSTFVRLCATLLNICVLAYSGDIVSRHACTPYRILCSISRRYFHCRLFNKVIL